MFELYIHSSKFLTGAVGFGIQEKKLSEDNVKDLSDDIQVHQLSCLFCDHAEYCML